MKTVEFRSLWRKQLGQIFGPIWINRKLSPSLLASTSLKKNELLLLTRLDQPSVFCGADSGELPGIYSTALLHEYSNLVLRPIDLLSLLSQSSTENSEKNQDFASCLVELMNSLDNNNENGKKIQDQSFHAVPFSSSSPPQTNFKLSPEQQIAYDIRCFSLASCLCSAQENQQLSCSSSLSGSWKWFLQNQEEEEEAPSELQQKRYRDLVMFSDSADEDSSNNSHFFFSVPPLERLVSAWSFVRTRSICIYSQQQQQEQEQEQDQQNSSSLAVPCLVPFLSSHLLRQSSSSPSSLNISVKILTASQLEKEQGQQKEEEMVYVGSRFLHFPFPISRNGNKTGKKKMRGFRMRDVGEEQQFIAVSRI